MRHVKFFKLVDQLLSDGVSFDAFMLLCDLSPDYDLLKHLDSKISHRDNDGIVKYNDAKFSLANTLYPFGVEKLSVLLVEDLKDQSTRIYESLLYAVKDSLTQLHISIARTANAAKDYIDDGSFDVILMDHDLGGEMSWQNGASLTRYALKKDATTKIIGISGLPMHNKSMMGNGAFASIEKIHAAADTLVPMIRKLYEQDVP